MVKTNECTGDNRSAYSFLSVGILSLLMAGLIWIFVFLSILSFPQTPTLCFCFSFCTQPSFSVLHSSFIVVRLFPPLFISVQVCPSSNEKKNKQQHCNFICPLFLKVICFHNMSISTVSVFVSDDTVQWKGRQHLLFPTILSMCLPRHFLLFLL